MYFTFPEGHIDIVQRDQGWWKDFNDLIHLNNIVHQLFLSIFASGDAYSQHPRKIDVGLKLRLGYVNFHLQFAIDDLLPQVIDLINNRLWKYIFIPFEDHIHSLGIQTIH